MEYSDISYGYTPSGKKEVFETVYRVVGLEPNTKEEYAVNCDKIDLVSLYVAEGVTHLQASYCGLKEIHLPSTIDYAHCVQNKLEIINLPEGMTGINCHGNNFKKLSIPSTITFLICSDNNLTEVVLPNGIESVCCGENNISYLEIPESLQSLEIDNANLSKINIPPKGKLKYLKIENNNLSEINITYKLSCLRIRGNNIKRIDNLPEGFKRLYCDKNVKGLEPYIDTDIYIFLH